MVVQSFRQLQYELGHRDAKSVQSYLDRAQEFEPSDSIFFDPQASALSPQVKPAAAPTWIATEAPDQDQPRGHLLH
jgi:hypothetical protein